MEIEQSEAAQKFVHLIYSYPYFRLIEKLFKIELESKIKNLPRP